MLVQYYNAIPPSRYQGQCKAYRGFDFLILCCLHHTLLALYTVDEGIEDLYSRLRSCSYCSSICSLGMWHTSESFIAVTVPQQSRKQNGISFITTRSSLSICVATFLLFSFTLLIFRSLHKPLQVIHPTSNSSTTFIDFTPSENPSNCHNSLDTYDCL